MPAFAARAIKITLVLDAVEVFSVRKCLGPLRQSGPEAVAVIIQGKLMRDDTIAEAGLVAQLRVPKPAEPAPVAAA
jgi:hypothetical protein